jgi:acetolactate synthase-1/2/3 large subunit
VRTNALRRRDDPVISLPRVTEDVYAAVTGKPWVLAVRNHRSWQDGLWQFTGSGEYLGGDGGGGVGYGPAAAAGAALALKGTGKFAVAILGDGEFLMAPGALWTAATHKVPLLIVILNNRTWGNDEFHQREIAEQRGRPPENAHVGQRMTDPDIDIAAIAKGFGIWSTGPVREPAKLAAALKAAVAIVERGGIALVEVVTALD